MLHKDILTISYKHRYELKKVFDQLLGLNSIEHISLDLVNPKGEMIFLSATPSHGYEICKRGYGPYDGIISPEHYQNYEFYWWKDACHKAYAEAINAIREGVLGMRHGFMLVRKWNDFYLIYSFATKSSDPHFQSKVMNNINELLRMGDYAYNELTELYAEYAGEYVPPKIEKFYKFEGGKPPARYTKDYQKTQSGLFVPNEHKIVTVDFTEKRIIGKN